MARSLAVRTLPFGSKLPAASVPADGPLAFIWIEPKWLMATRFYVGWLLSSSDVRFPPQRDDTTEPTGQLGEVIDTDGHTVTGRVAAGKIPACVAHTCP